MVYSTIRELGKRVTGYAVNKAADYAYSGAKRRIDNYFSPSPKRRKTGSSRSPAMKTPVNRVLRFTPKRSQRTVAMSNLRRRLQRTPAITRRKRGGGYRYGAANSKSSGFIQTNIPVKYRGVSRATNLGVVEVIETGGVLDAGIESATAGNTVAVGHCQFPPALAHRTFWRCMVKKLATQCRMPVRNFEEPLNLNEQSSWQITYRLKPESAWVTHSYGVPAPPATVSLETVANNFFLHFEALDDAEDLELHQIAFINRDTVVTTFHFYSSGMIDLANASFVIFSKSTLKVQNRTVGSTGGDEESVDNVPLYGKAFYGKGSGTGAITNDQVPGVAASAFFCQAINGTLAKVPTEKWYQEIPQPSHFMNVLSTGKVHLDPGHIKTSTLDGKVSVPFSKLFKLLFRTDSASNTHAKAYLGRFRMIMLEKMLTTVVSVASNSIKCAYEHNIRIGGYVKLKRSTETAQMNSVYNLANAV